ncbi:MAG: carboxypeptidase-like regulatory domain-containing protein [Solirubrobacterales bacterium]
MSGALDLAAKVVGFLAALLGLAGYVLLIGATIVWLRLKEAHLPTEASLALAGREELIATGAQAVAIWLILAILFGCLAVWIAAGDPGRRRFGKAEALFAIAVTTSAAFALDSPWSPGLVALPALVAVGTALVCWSRRPPRQAALSALLPAAAGLTVAYAVWRLGKNGFADAFGEALIFTALMLAAPWLQHTKARWEANQAAIAQLEPLGKAVGPEGKTTLRLLEELRRPRAAGGGPRSIVWLRGIAIGAFALLVLGGIAVASQVDREENFNRGVLLLANGTCVSGTYIVRGDDQIVLAHAKKGEKQKQLSPRHRIATFATKEVREVLIYGKSAAGYPLGVDKDCGPDATMKSLAKSADNKESGGKQEAPAPKEDPPPGGTHLPGSKTGPDGIPVIDWKKKGKVTVRACRGASLTLTVVVGGRVLRGQLEEVAGSAGQHRKFKYVGTYPPAYPGHGRARVVIAGSCPNGSPVDIEFNIHVDPSGRVVDTEGHPVEGATVTLLRSRSPDGPFTRVPTGSKELATRNRVNPDTTGADGRFSWDVAGGYYVVRASKAGCTSAAHRSSIAARTAVLEIPPPSVGLLLVLSCKPDPR